MQVSARMEHYAAFLGRRCCGARCCALTVALMIVVGPGLAGARAGEPCTPEWTDAGAVLVHGGSPAPIVLSLTEFDPDGTGPLQRDLYMSGSFGFLDAPDRSSIARWNGLDWQEVGITASGSNPIQDRFYAMCSGTDIATNDGRQALYVAGTFRSINGMQAPLVAKWNGEEWSSFGPLPNIAVWGLALHDFDGPSGAEPTRLVIGGILIPSVGGLTPGVRYWDGEVWLPLGGPCRVNAKGVVSFDPDGQGPIAARLFVSRFAAEDGVNGICEWTGSGWVKRADQNEVYCEFIVFDPDGDGPVPPTLYAANSRDLLRLDEQDQWVSEGIPASTLGILPASIGGSGLPTLFAAGGTPAITVWRLDSSGWSVFAHSAGGGCGAPQALYGFDEDGAGPREPSLFLGGCLTSFAATPASGIARYGCVFVMPRCFGDADGSGVVDFNDISLILTRWGSHDQPGDIDRDGVVGMNDIVAVLASWGSVCEESLATAARPVTAGTGTSWRERGIEDFNGDGVVDIADEIWAISNAGLDPRSPYGRELLQRR